MKTEIRSTTIIGVRHKRKVAMAGDGILSREPIQKGVLVHMEHR